MSGGRYEGKRRRRFAADKVKQLRLGLLVTISKLADSCHGREEVDNFSFIQGQLLTQVE